MRGEVAEMQRWIASSHIPSVPRSLLPAFCYSDSMDRLKCPHCGEVIGEGSGCEHCRQASGPTIQQQLDLANKRLEHIETKLGSINGKLHSALTVFITVVVLYALVFIVSFVLNMTRTATIMRQFGQPSDIIQ